MYYTSYSHSHQPLIGWRVSPVNDVEYRYFGEKFKKYKHFCFANMKTGCRKIMDGVCKKTTTLLTLYIFYFQKPKQRLLCNAIHMHSNKDVFSDSQHHCVVPSSSPVTYICILLLPGAPQELLQEGGGGQSCAAKMSIRHLTSALPYEAHPRVLERVSRRRFWYSTLIVL